MAMETFSLLDDEKQSTLRTDLTLPEIYKTRLIRVDLGARRRTDPFQRWIHRQLRAFRYWKISRSRRNRQGLRWVGRDSHWSYQNTILIATVMGRAISATAIAAFLVVPLIILSDGVPRSAQLVIVSVCILIFSFLVAAMLRVSNFEMMAVSAAYAAVLSVFVSNGSAT
jgi:hypothetical protein